MIERDGNIKAQVVKKKDLAAKRLTSFVRQNVDVKNATLMTGEYHGYIGIKYIMPHETVNHKTWYVREMLIPTRLNLSGPY